MREARKFIGGPLDGKRQMWNSNLPELRIGAFPKDYAPTAVMPYVTGKYERMDVNRDGEVLFLWCGFSK